MRDSLGICYFTQKGVILQEVAAHDVTHLTLLCRLFFSSNFLHRNGSRMSNLLSGLMAGFYETVQPLWSFGIEM